MSTNYVSPVVVIYKSLGFLGYPTYRVGTDGSVWSWRRVTQTWKRLVPSYNRGYPQHILCGKIVKRKSWLVHRLVLEAFVGPKPRNRVCRHLDGNRRNNNLWNLCWGTHLENHNDKRIHGTTPAGEKNYGAKLKAEQVIEIRKMFREGRTRNYILAVYKISRCQLNKILTRFSWGHLPD